MDVNYVARNEMLLVLRRKQRGGGAKQPLFFSHASKKVQEGDWERGVAVLFCIPVGKVREGELKHAGYYGRPGKD